VAVFAFAVDKIGDGGVRRFPLVDPDAEFLLEHDVLADGTQSDALAFRFQMEGVAGSKLQAVTKGLGQNDAAGSIEGELGDHDGSIVWEKPIVNGIGEKNEWKPVQKRKVASGVARGKKKQIPHCVRDDIGREERGATMSPKRAPEMKGGPPRKAGPTDQDSGGGGQPGNSRREVLPIY
jgi:hypothetical protein